MNSNPDRTVIATSFADPRDIEAFHRAKAKGFTDRVAFTFGDNGVGCWGDDTTVDRPMVALPPEDWKIYGKSARGKLVIVGHNGRTVTAELRDTMPARRNIHNRAGIDLNPAACEALGLEIPCRAQVTWRWLESSQENTGPGTAKNLLELIREFFAKLRK